MSEPITIYPEQLQAIVDTCVASTLTSLGIKQRQYKPFMSKSQASGLIGRRRLEAAIRLGVIVPKYGDTSKKISRVYISRADVTKLLNNPLK